MDTSDCYRNCQPSVGTGERRIFQSLHDNPYRVNKRRVNAYPNNVFWSNLPHEMSSSINYNDYYSAYSEPLSWGSPSNIINKPQFPSQNGNKIFPSPEMESALQKLMVDFNLAIDHKWNTFTEVDATLFQQDLLKLSNVVRSEFYRESEKLRKNGQNEPTARYDHAIREALENLVSHSQGERWYQRLRKNVGAATFRHIVNILIEFCINAFPINEDQEFEDEVESQQPSEALNEKLVNTAEKYLTSFDIALASRIKPYVMQLNEQDKKEFLSDIDELNEAVEDEILTELMSKASDGDLSAAYGQISQDVVNKVVLRYQDKPWFGRIMDFAGNEVVDTLRGLPKPKSDD
ncbi:unnamed protein product [Orchesella dallaii]|uniref:Uncharacterized protein n=1 Tax=Orchesella dallaii TaxID=48710 RepID=A0ABP1R225_9HEXA